MPTFLRRGTQVLVALGLGVGLAGCRKQAVSRAKPEVAVVVVTPQRAVLTSELPGRVSALQVAQVHPQVSGIVLRRTFEEGSDVEAGEVLYEIDPAPYRAAFASAQASLARAEAGLSAARKRAERVKALLAARAVHQQDWDDASAALQLAEAEVQSGKAVVESARINLAYTRVTAPISGRSGRSSVTPGALAVAYQEPAFTTIQQLNAVFVDCPQSSAAILGMRRRFATHRASGSAPRRTPVRLILEDGTPYPMGGVLRFSDVTVDPATGSQNLRMVFPNPGLVLLPGMYVRAVVEEGVLEEAILVPQQGVTRDPKGHAIAMVVDGNDRVEQRQLEVDRALGDRWLVREGLRPGDRLILEGLQKVRPGTAVTVVPLGPKPEDRK